MGSSESAPKEFWLNLVDHELLSPIGLVVIHWSILEHLVESAIWTAAGLPPNIGRAMTAQTQLQSKLDMLATLLHESQPELAEPFDTLCNFVRSWLLGRRNLFVHGFWMTDPSTYRSYAMKHSAKGKLVFQGEEITAEEAMALVNDIIEVAEWFRAFSPRIRKWRRSPSAPARKSRVPRNPQDYAIQKQRALRPLDPPKKVRKTPG